MAKKRFKGFDLLVKASIDTNKDGVDDIRRQHYNSIYFEN